MYILKSQYLKVKMLNNYETLISPYESPILIDELLFIHQLFVERKEHEMTMARFKLTY